MKNGKIRRPEVVEAFDLREIRNNYHTGLLFRWGGYRYGVFFPSPNMSAGRPVGLARVESSGPRQFEHTPTMEAYRALLEDGGEAIERVLSRLDSSGTVTALLWDILYMVSRYGYRYEKWEHPDLALEELELSNQTLKRIKEDCGEFPQISQETGLRHDQEK